MNQITFVASNEKGKQQRGALSKNLHNVNVTNTADYATARNINCSTVYCSSIDHCQNCSLAEKLKVHYIICRNVSTSCGSFHTINMVILGNSQVVGKYCPFLPKQRHKYFHQVFSTFCVRADQERCQGWCLTSKQLHVAQPDFQQCLKKQLYYILDT